MGDKLGYFRVTLPRPRMNTAKESAFYQLFPRSAGNATQASTPQIVCRTSHFRLRNYSLQQAYGIIPVPHHSLVIL